MTSELRRHLLWLIAARAAVVTLLLGSAILIQIKSPGSEVDPFFFLIGLTYALTVAYSLTLKQAEKRRWVIDVQLACDAVIVSVVVHLTGGVTSYFSPLYALPIIAGSTIQSWRGGMMVAVLSAVMYAGLVVLQYFGTPSLLAYTSAFESPAPMNVALFTVGLNVFGFVAVAGLSGYLAEGLRRADAQLERASTQLADLQAFNQHVIDSLTSGLATTDTRGQIMTFNRAAEAITGLSAGHAIRRAASEVLQLPASFDAWFGPVEERPRSPRFEVGFKRPDGRQIELGMSVAPLMTPRGETGFLLTFQDVTEARRQEREARVQQRLAAVGEMAAGIAHEIRNPLASMSGSIQILRQELPLTDEQGQLMDIVLRESERLNETISSFLTYAKPQRQMMRRIDVRQIVTDTATLLKNSTEILDGHEVTVSVPKEPAWFQADESQLRQIVWNLATNGLRAMPHGGRLTLTVTPPSDASPELVIAVTDEGVGIATEDIDGIFQPFRGAFQRGTGLGLSIVHRIVTDYGGQVKVESTKGKGTTVFVKWPIAIPAGV
jgi:two-component system sensor histidine kinase PilS (NtrC family)